MKYVVLLFAAMLIIVSLTPNCADSHFRPAYQRPSSYRSIRADRHRAYSQSYNPQSSRASSWAPPAPQPVADTAPPPVAVRGKLYNRTRTRTKDRRKVSLALQKQVAASQGWKCAHCWKMLPSTFQTDHRIPLYTDQEGLHTEFLNSAANLDCLCNDCHAAKTQRESIIYKDLLQSLRAQGKRR